MITRRKSLQRKTPLRRGKAPRRKTPVVKRRRRPRRSERVRDEAYLTMVRELGYCAARRFFGNAAGPCEGDGVDPDHMGERPVGRKASDDTAVPMCRAHHDARTDYQGVFKGWDAARMRAWCDARIAETRAALNGGEDGVFSW